MTLSPRPAAAARHFRAIEVVLWGAVGLLSLGCGAVQLVDGGEAAPFALLQIECDPPDATISVDGSPVAVLTSLRDHTLPVPAGVRQIEVAREGYLPYLLDLKAEAGRQYRLELDLLRDLDEELDAEGEGSAPLDERGDPASGRW